MIKLRPYQQNLIEGIRNAFTEGKRRIVLCAATGSGKTVMFTFMVKEHLKKGGKALILTDRINLLQQANGTFDKFGIQPELITAGSKPDLSKGCHVAMIETLHRRAEKYSDFLSSRTLIVIDEAHKTAFSKIFPHISDDCFVIGATATPIRTGNQPSMAKDYEDIIQQVDTPDLIKLGNLSSCRTYGVKMDLSNIKRTGGDYDSKELGDMYSKREVYKGVIENYQRITPNTKSIAFAANIQSAEELCSQMNKAGIRAAVIHSNQSKDYNETCVQRFTDFPSGMAACLINVGILTAGFDCPDIETVILYRATTSLSLFLQMVGRGSRVTETKNHFNLLDFGNNISNHDFWEAKRTWSLEKKKKKLGVAPVKECPECGSLNLANAPVCVGKKYLPEENDVVDCGYKFPVKEQKKSDAEVYLERLGPINKSEAMKKATDATVEELVYLSKAKLISPFWVLHTLENKEIARKFINLMGYSKKFEHANRHRFKVFRK